MQSQQLVNGNLCLAKAGLTGLSGAATTFTTGAAVLFALGGKAYSRAAIAGGATPTLDAATGKAIAVQPGTGTVVLWCLDAAGVVKLVQGSVEQLDASNGFQFSPPQFPLVGDDLTPFAYSVHRVAAGAAAFTIGTSLWNAANSFHAAQDIITIPGRPQAA